MKKIIFLLLISGSLKAQNIDTVRVRNLSLQAQDWAWLVGKLGTGQDSISAYDYRKVRSVVQSNIPQTWTTSVSIDSLHGRTVMAMYQAVKTGNAGEIAARYSAITSAISAKANLAYWVGLVDGAISNDYDRNRNLGKLRLLDQ